MKHLSHVLLLALLLLGPIGLLAQDYPANPLLDELAQSPPPSSPSPAAPPDPAAPEETHPPTTAASARQPLRVEAETAVDTAVKTYADTGLAPTIYRFGAETFPYGHSTPVLYCAPVAVCTIELEPGEHVADWAIGDSANWFVAPLGEAETVVVKPKADALATNLLILTDRNRRYHIDLRSLSSKESASQAIARRISFYYPDDVVGRWRAARAATQVAITQAAAHTVTGLVAEDLTRLNFNYDVRPWRGSPQRVFDDGTKTYIQLAPRRGGAQDLPALLVEHPDGTTALTNFRPTPDGQWFVVDQVLRGAQLLYKEGRRQHAATIRNLDLPEASTR